MSRHEMASPPAGVSPTARQPVSVAPTLPVGHHQLPGAHHGVDLRAVRLDPLGPLGGWQRKNADATIPHCIDQLEDSGVLDNFRRVIGESGAAYRGFVFADSDLYKVIEAVAWEIGRSGSDRWNPWLDEVIGLVARVQEPSGYVMTWIQGVHPEKKFAELEWTHEMYVLGHMVQAAIALDRAAGRSDLLELALRFVDLIDRRFGPGREQGICGHPEIETALIELYRHTGERRYLELAERMIDLRGLGLLTVGGLGPRYFQDHAPVREAREATGHAVRQLYLNAGVTDLYLETGETALWEAMEAQWESAHHRKMYLTGAFGSRHRDEAFGDDYELPSDRAYAETCATIADIHWNWRMLLASGEARYAEMIEREVHNALAASVDASGTRFFYANPLQLRPDRQSEVNAPRERQGWYECACCPPNIARVLAQLGAYVASATRDGLALHLYTAGEIDLPDHLGLGVVRVETEYPATGTIRLTLEGEAADGAVLMARIPSWSSWVRVNGADVAADSDGYLRLPLADLVGGVTLDLDVSPRWTQPHHRIDAVRGCAALERGPVVYCVEQADTAGASIDDLSIDLSSPLSPAEIDGTPALSFRASVHASGVVPYSPATASPSSQAEEVMVTAVPFSTWGNRQATAMRVWLPTT